MLDADVVGDAGPWLTSDMVFQAEWLENRAVGIKLPAVAEPEIVETAPVLRGATKSASTKPAKLANVVPTRRSPRPPLLDRAATSRRSPRPADRPRWPRPRVTVPPGTAPRRKSVDRMPD